jgi:HK97 family phage major capsid protein
MEAKDLHIEMQNIFHQFKAKNDEALAEAKKFGSSVQETVNQVDALNDRISELETKLARPSLVGNSSSSRSDNEVKAFSNWMSKGLGALPMEQKAVLQMDNLEGGGYLVVPEQMLSELLKAVDDATPIRQLARKFRVNGAASLGVPTLDSDPSDFAWTSELGTIAEDTSMAFGKRSLTPHRLTKRVLISRDLLRQAAMNPEQIVMDRLAYKFAISENKAFLTGSGAQQPLGLFTASDQGIPTSRDSQTASSTAFTADELIDIKHSMKANYWPNLRWLFHRDFLVRARKLKDGNGVYIWNPGFNGIPNTLVDVPYVLDENAPNTFTSGNYVAIIGDFNYYWIVDSMQMEMQRLEELYAATSQVGFIGRAKLDAQPVLAEAFKRVKLA